MIRIIRREDEPKPVLMKRFKLSDEQAEEILNTRLRHLAKLEEMKIREEQKALAAEREELEALLKSKAKLKKLIAAEIRADAEKYGDERRTKIIEREAAQAIDETSLIPNEPVTVVLSTGGWVRSAKGHDIDAGALSYKSGDAFQALARGRSLQPAVFIDSTGRTYSAAGAFAALRARLRRAALRAAGSARRRELRRRDDRRARGSVAARERCRLRLHRAPQGAASRDRRAGKTVLSVPENAHVLAPAPVPGADSLVAVVSSEGKLLVFPVGEVPEMPRGKGNKLYDIPGQEGACAQRADDGGRGRTAQGEPGAVVGRGAEGARVARAAGLPRRARAARRGAQARLAAQHRPHGGARLAAGLKRCAAVRAPSARPARLPRAR